MLGGSFQGVGLAGGVEAALEPLANLEGLRKLDLSANRLTGALPTSNSILNTDISYLSLGGNPLSGGVPPALGHLTDLTFLNLSRCGLSGALPDSLYDLTDVVTLDLSRNDLSGPICSNVSRHCWASACTNMEHVDLSLNDFSGPIPLFTHGGCPRYSMKTMNFGHNAFNGGIPDQLAMLGAPISELNLQSNQLSGAVPASLKRIPLTALRLDGNRLSGVVPPLPFGDYRYCDMKDNAFDCPLPPGADECRDGAPTCTGANA